MRTGEMPRWRQAVILGGGIRFRNGRCRRIKIHGRNVDQVLNGTIFGVDSKASFGFGTIM